MLDLGKLRQHIKALSNGDDQSRRQAIGFLKGHESSIWASAPSKVIDPLVESLRHQLINGTQHASSRQDVLALLGHMGRHSSCAIPQIVELLKEGHPEGVREAAAVALRRIGGADARVKNALTAVWLARSLAQAGQVQVAISLCKLKIPVPGASRFLALVLVQHQVSGLRNAAAEGLASCNKNDVDVVPALLVAALNDKDENVRNVAKASLEKLHLPIAKAIQLCAKQLDSSNFAEAAMRFSGEQAIPALIEALRAKEIMSREKAARLLGRLGEQAAVATPALTAALRDKNAEFRLAAAKGLWNISKQADVVVPVLIDLLKGKWAAEQAAQAVQMGQDGVEVRRQFLQTVIEALQRIGPPAEKAVAALKEKVRDKNRLVAESARRALEVIAPAVALKI
ncbi:MAG: hypothetical protein FJ271_04675 [Planctomycetes bacterium]|nr:hypothetical protein [Planctomycetota bacterium]